MTWKLWAAVGLIALASLGSFYGLWQRSTVKELRTEVSTLKNRVAGLESSERALRDSAEVADRARRKAQEEATRTRKELDHALQGHSDWAAVPVPGSVYDALKPKQYRTP